VDDTQNGSLEETHILWVLPLEMTFAGVIYWRICDGNANNCVGLCDDLPSALAQANEWARQYREAGKPARVVWRKPRDMTWPQAEAAVAPARHRTH
jgi:hypothetical protein